MWDILFSNYIAFLLLFVRMMGMFIFNPLFGRKNIPVIIKMGLAFFITVILMGMIPDTAALNIDNMLTFLLVSIKELFIGFFVGFIMQMFLSVLQLSGEFIDLQLGVGMAQVYDPGSKTSSMPLTGSMLNLFYTVIFFVTNGHLTLIRIISSSLDIIPLGTLQLNADCGQYVVLFFGNILALALKMALPVVALEIITELGLGILMRTVPQINVFVVGLQLKLLFGLVMIVIVLPGFFDYFDYLTNNMFNSIINGLNMIV